MKYARVVNGIVLEVIDLPDSLIPGVNIYHPDIAHQFHEIPKDLKVAEGWHFDGKTFSSPPQPQEHSTHPTSNRQEEDHDKGKEQH